MSYLLQDANGQISPTHSVSAGLDYASVGPEHSWLRDTGRATYSGISDAWAMQALDKLAKSEGILCAIETAHAFAGACDWGRAQVVAGRDARDLVIIINTSGRGDKDVDTAARWFGLVEPPSAATS